jgi:hypothetical protein
MKNHIKLSNSAIYKEKRNTIPIDQNIFFHLPTYTEKVVRNIISIDLDGIKR